ncbi:MAG: S8 family serine peptidase [Bacteroidota bacterium]
MIFTNLYRIKFLFFFIFLAVLTCFCSAQPVKFPQSLFNNEIQDDYINGQLFVKIKNTCSLDISYDSLRFTKFQRFSKSDFEDAKRLSILIQKYDIKKIHKPFILDNPKLQKTYLIEFGKTTMANNLIEEFKQLDFIDYSEKVPNYQLFYTPNDLHTNQWYLPQIQAESAWDISTGSDSVIVAIVDNAVSTIHEDLIDNLWVNPGEIDGNSIDDDGNGYTDDINGYDVADYDNDPNPPTPTDGTFAHGTHCAGITSAATDNSTGIASIGFKAKIMAVKSSTDASGGLSLAAAYLGVQYAITAGADIISMSWGGGAYSQTYQNLFTQAHNNGIVLIAAAGNSNTTIPHYPSAYNNVISVGSTNSSDSKSWFSNYGTTIDVMAPGSNIWSCLAGSTSSYGYKSGTSMACPLVSGLAALMLAKNPYLTPDDLEACLKGSCDNIDAQNPSYIGLIGAGRINAYQALLCLKPITAQFTSDITQVCPGGTVNFTDLSNNDPISWDWNFPGGTPSSSTLQNPVITYNTAGTYDVTLIVTNSLGSDTITQTVYITVSPPSAFLSGAATIPFGFSANLKVDLTGNPPWSITYSDGTTTYAINNITNSPYYITVSPADTITYTLVSVNDNGCAGNVSGSATINVTDNSGCSLTSTFQKTFGGTADDEGISIALTNDGGSIIIGTTQSFGAGNIDVYVIKLNACGYTQWTKTYGGASSDRGAGILQTIDGGYIMTAYTQSFGAGNLDYLLIKTDSLGVTQWSYSYGLSGADYPRVIQQTNDGGYIVGGVTSSMGAGSSDFSMFKVDATGNLLWTKSYGNSANDFLHLIEVTSDGGFILSGYRRDYTVASREAYLIKTDSIGNVQWSKTYSGPQWEQADNVIQTDNGYLITSYTNSYGAGGMDIMLVNVDNNGNIIWSKTYGGTFEDKGLDAVQIPGEGYYIIGNTQSYGNGGTDLYLMKIDTIGNLITAIAIGDSGDDDAWTASNNVRLTANGNLIISGWTDSYGAGNNDVYVIKSDPVGEILCTDISQTPTINNITLTVVNNTPVVSTNSFSQNTAAIQVTNPPTLDSIICTDVAPQPPVACIGVMSHQKTSDTEGNFSGILDNNDHFGQGIANIGDLNNDGIMDLADRRSGR